MLWSCSSTYYISGMVAMKKGFTIWHTKNLYNLIYQMDNLLNKLYKYMNWYIGAAGVP